MESLSIVGLIDVVYCHYPFSRRGEDGWILNMELWSEGSHARKLAFATINLKLLFSNCSVVVSTTLSSKELDDLNMNDMFTDIPKRLGKLEKITCVDDEIF